MTYSNRLKRLLFIKKFASKKFEKALLEGEIVPTAREMNVLYPRRKRIKRLMRM
jgi:hypothetical protein